MAENKGITEVQALTVALEILKDSCDDEEVAQAYEKLEHMREVRSRKHDRKKDDSKRLANIALGEQFADSFEGETFKSADVAAVLNVSISKACAVCRAMEWEEVPTTEKVKVYKL